MNRYRKAVPERNKQVEAHRGFTASINPDDIKQWTGMCERWEAAEFPKNNVDNPYHIESTGLFDSSIFSRLDLIYFLDLTQAQVRQQLAEEEEKLIAGGSPVLHEISPSTFLLNGLDIEESQYVSIYFLKNII